MESSFYTSQIVVFVIIGIVFMLLMALVVVLLSNRAEKQIFRQRMDNQELQLKHQQELLERNLLVQEEERQTNDKLTLTNVAPVEKKSCC